MVAFNNIIDVVLVAVFFNPPSRRASACRTISAGPAVSSSHAVTGQPIFLRCLPRPRLPWLLLLPALYAIALAMSALVSVLLAVLLIHWLMLALGKPGPL